MIGMAAEQARRLNPRVIDTDWLVLRDLRAAIATHAPRIARKGTTALDFGCGSKPDRRLAELPGHFPSVA